MRLTPTYMLQPRSSPLLNHLRSKCILQLYLITTFIVNNTMCFFSKKILGSGLEMQVLTIANVSFQDLPLRLHVNSPICKCSGFNTCSYGHLPNLLCYIFIQQLNNVPCCPQLKVYSSLGFSVFSSSFLFKSMIIKYWIKANTTVMKKSAPITKKTNFAI